MMEDEVNSIEYWTKNWTKNWPKWNAWAEEGSLRAGANLVPRSRLS